MTLPAKLGVGALTLGSCTAAGCVGVIYSRQGTAINELVNKEYEYILLDTSADTNNKDKTTWGEVWKNYKKDSKNIFNLAGWKSDNSDFDLTEALKKKCSELSSSKVLSKESTLYKNVTKYCARGVTFAEQAAKDKLTILNTTETTHDKIWGERHKTKDTMTTHLQHLEITSSNSNGSDIKTGCGKAKDKNKQVKNYENIYNSYKLVCTKQSTDTE